MTGEPVFRGRVRLFGDDVNTDVLHPSRFFSLDRLTVQAGLNEAAGGGEGPWILVGGRNFGYGSSRETTIQALRMGGVVGVVARSVSRIFWRNALNAGLAVLAAPEAPEAFAAEAELVLEPLAGRILAADGRLLAEVAALKGWDADLLRAGGMQALLAAGALPLVP